MTTFNGIGLWRIASAAALLAVLACIGGWTFARRPNTARTDAARHLSSASEPALFTQGEAESPADKEIRLVGWEDSAPVEHPHTFDPNVCRADCPLCAGAARRRGARRPIGWQQVFAQGEYVGPPRVQHVPEYRLRVDDSIAFTYRIARTVEPQYKLNVGDEIRIESAVDKDLDRRVEIEPDGMITLPYVGQVRAAGRSVVELKTDLNKRFTEFYRDPSITVSPTRTHTRLQDLRSAVDARAAAGGGGQGITANVIPDGTVWLPAIGKVSAQGLSLDELRQEVNARYREIVHGLDVTPALMQRAPRFAYVLGEVTNPQRIQLDGPTSAMMAISRAGGWRIGGNLKQIVVFRRTEDWRLIATRLNLRGPLWGKTPNAADDLFLRDSDIVLVPKNPMQLADDFINLVFTQGIYGVFPNQGFALNSTL